MLRLVIRPLSSDWSKLVYALFDDLEPLGHRVQRLEDGGLALELTEPEEHDHWQKKDPDNPNRKSVNFWDRAHEIRHLAFLKEQKPTILALEERLEDIFVRTDLFQPSAVQPVLESIDFKNNRHRDIVQYLSLCQTVTSRKLVGRRMGLLLWDDGQTGHRPLIGVAILSSPRFSQRMRDQYLGWPKSYPRTHERFVQAERDLRLRGLGRIMHLSIACALPPYSQLSGAWLAAAAPFTPDGQKAFERSCRKES